MKKRIISLLAFALALTLTLAALGQAESLNSQSAQPPLQTEPWRLETVMVSWAGEQCLARPVGTTQWKEVGIGVTSICELNGAMYCAIADDPSAAPDRATHSLYLWDRETSASRLIAALPAQCEGRLAALNGKLYAFGSEDSLFEIDPVTGAARRTDEDPHAVLNAPGASLAWAQGDPYLADGQPLSSGDASNDAVPADSGAEDFPFAEPEPIPQPSPAVKPEKKAGASGYAALERGDRGELVRKLQKRLSALGYLSGTADGVFGKKTQTAVKRFQAQIKQKQTGTATIALQKKLFSKNAPKYIAPARFVELAPGSTGQQVQKLQRRLKDLGYFYGEIGGNYLDLTTEAVKRFQQKLGVEQTGIATVALQKKLFAKNAPRHTESGFVHLAPGATGKHVKTLQRRLKALGYFKGKIGGNYLKLTTAAVKAFQKKSGVDPDGIASVELLKLLFAEDAPRA